MVKFGLPVFLLFGPPDSALWISSLKSAYFIGTISSYSLLYTGGKVDVTARYKCFYLEVTAYTLGW